MVSCAVFNCKSNNNKKLKRNAGGSVGAQDNIRFFRFPKNPSYAKIWMQKCSRKDKFNIKNSFICSKHFTNIHYIRNLQHELLNYSPKNSKKLKPDAIPSENLPVSTLVSQPVTKRQERQEKRQLKASVATSIW